MAKAAWATEAAKTNTRAITPQREHKRGGENSILQCGGQLQSPKRAINIIINQTAPICKRFFFITLTLNISAP